MSLDEPQERVGANREDTEARGETFYPGPLSEASYRTANGSDRVKRLTRNCAQRSNAADVKQPRCNATCCLRRMLD